MDLNSYAVIVGGVLSAVFSIVPGLSDWYYGINTKYRGLIMVGFVALVSVVMYLLSCYTVSFVTVACGNPGVETLLKLFGATIAGNQMTYWVFPESPAKARLAKKNV